MKKLFTSRKFHSLFRRTVCIVVMLTTALCFPLQMGFADDSLLVGMKWTRIKSQKMMDKYFGPTNDKNLNSVNDWSRCLILSPDGKYYVRGCNSDGSEARDDENMTLTQVTGTSGIKSGKDTFTTRSDLGATSIKYVSFDSEHGGNKYYIRCNGVTNANTTTSFDNYCIAINMSWYGIKWYAAAKAEYRRAPVNDPGSASDRASWACSATISTEWTIAFGQTLDVGGKTITEDQMKALRVAWYYYDGGAHGTNFWYTMGIYQKQDYPKYLEYAALNGYGDNSIFHSGLADEAYKLADGKDANDRNNYTITEDYFKTVIAPAAEAYEAANEDVRNDCAMITFNTEHGGVHDRTWNYNGSGQVDFAKSEGNSGKISFMIYAGQACAISVLIVNTTIAPYTYDVLTDYTIKNSVQVTVQKGATLAIESTCYNNGRIVVDGGTLIIKGCLDSDPNQSDGEFTVGTTKEIYRPGDIVIKNGGTLIIEEGASLLHRNAGAELRIEDSSYMRVKGLICVANALVVKGQSQVRVDSGCLVLVGTQPNIVKGADDYNMSVLRQYADQYMSSYISLSSYMLNAYFSSTRTGGYSGLIVQDQSSYINYGGTFAPYGVSISSDSDFESKVSTNIEATIGSMMANW